uniref:Putative monooxygenase n=1 Tax=Fusarium sp. TaxID=29916 RepID=A0A1Y0B9L2_FUSSX|nr:putative monooxygenase [Fusarium sp.]
MQESSEFKVIIIGAGVTVLTLAHCLAKAGIDFVLLGKGVVAPSFGTTITLQPHGCRILHQLGCLDAVLAKCDTMGGAHCRDPTGRSFAYNDFFGVVRKFAGYDTRTLDRQVFLRQLYELLPDKSQVYEKARVEHIIEEDSVARVILADGREFVGDVVVGSDGVHSKVREIMWDKANALHPGIITVDEKRAMVTQYNAIVMASSPVPGIGAHDMEITSNDKYSFLLLCQPDWISIIVHSKLPEDQQCTWPTRRRYSEADMEALVSKISERPVTDTVVFGELWKRHLKAQMISLEEGVLEYWTFGRIVRAGDAVHKVTPNSALRGNTAMEDAVVIANTLHALLARHPNKKPSDVELYDAMRQEYQETRVDRARAIVQAGGALTREQAYDVWKAYITQRWLTPIIGLDKLAQKIAGLCVTAPKLSYVEFDERRRILGWQDTMEAEKKHAAKGQVAKKEKTGMSWSNWNVRFEAVFPHISGVLVVLWLALWSFHLIASEDHVLGFGTETPSFVESFQHELEEALLSSVSLSRISTSNRIRLDA